MTLDPISIATIGYVCGGAPRAIPIALHGYVCLARRRPRRGGGGNRGFGARVVLKAGGTAGLQGDACELMEVSIAVIAIETVYDD